MFFAAAEETQLLKKKWKKKEERKNKNIKWVQVINVGPAVRKVGLWGEHWGSWMDTGAKII